MGYAKPGQNTAGIHLRQHARAFVFDDGVHDRGVFVSVDIGMMGDLVKERVSIRIIVCEHVKDPVFSDIGDSSFATCSWQHL